MIVGPSFCAEAQLLLNTLIEKRLDSPKIEIKVKTRSSEHYSDLDLDLTVEEEFESKTIEDHAGGAVVFDDTLDSN